MRPLSKSKTTAKPKPFDYSAQLRLMRSDPAEIDCSASLPSKEATPTSLSADSIDNQRQPSYLLEAKWITDQF